MSWASAQFETGGPDVILYADRRACHIGDARI